MEVDRLSAERPGASHSDPGLLYSILAGIRRWEAAVSPKAVQQSIANAVAPFLGGKATADLLGTVSRGGENLFSTVEPVIALFLGCRAASCMFDRIIDRSVTRSG